MRDRLNRPAGGSITDLQVGTFDEFVGDSRLVSVDFWASWCRPCRAKAPVIPSLARDYADIAFGNVNMETERELAERFGIRSIPTYLLFRHGAPVERFPGVASRDRPARKLDKGR